MVRLCTKNKKTVFLYYKDCDQIFQSSMPSNRYGSDNNKLARAMSLSEEESIEP